MPQIIVKNVEKEKLKVLAPDIAKAVADIIGVPQQHIVVEHNDVTFFRGGVLDTKSAMVWVSWKKRPREMQYNVAKALSEIFKPAGYSPVEVIYDNLDMDDFYEFE